MAIVSPGGDAPQMDEGLYTFKIIETKQAVRQDDTFGKAGEPVLEVYCEMADTEDEDGNPIVLRPIVALKFSQGGKFQPSTLFLLAKAAGVLPPEGQPFDTDLLEGRVMQGMVRQEEGKWPRIEPKSLMPVKAVKGQPVPIDFSKMSLPQSQKAQEAPSEGADATAPWDIDPNAVATIIEQARAIGFSPKEIIDVAQSEFGKKPAELTAEERDRFRIALGV